MYNYKRVLILASEPLDQYFKGPDWKKFQNSDPRKISAEWKFFVFLISTVTAC